VDRDRQTYKKRERAGGGRRRLRERV